MNRKKIFSTRFFTNTLITLFGIVVLLITILITYQVWFSSADSVYIGNLEINYPCPEYPQGSVPELRITAINNVSYPFLEVYDETAINQAFGTGGNQRPAYKIHYTLIIDQDEGITVQKPMAIVPLPGYQYSPSYLPREGDATYRLLHWAYEKVSNTNFASQRGLLKDAVNKYNQAITFAGSTYRVSNDILYSRDPSFQNTSASDPDVIKSFEFPDGNPNDPTRYWALTIPISQGYQYKQPTSSSLAIGVLQSGLREASRQGNTDDKNRIQAAKDNYSSQIQTSTGNEGLSIASRDQIENAGQDTVHFSADLKKLPIGPSYLKTLLLTINDIEVCKVEYSSENAAGLTSNLNCQWDDTSHSGTFPWNSSTGTDAQAISTEDQGTKAVKLKAFGSDNNIMRMMEKAVIVEPDFGDGTTTGNFGIKITLPKATNRVEKVPVKISASDLDPAVGAAFLRWYVCDVPREQVSNDSAECNIKDPEVDVNGKASLPETTVYWNSSGAKAGDTKSVMVKLFTAAATNSYIDGSKTFSANILVTDTQHGGGGGGGGGGTVEPPKRAANFRASALRTIDDIIHRLGSFTLYILGFLAVLAIIIAGMKYITSGGEPQKAEAGKKGVLFAIYGIIIAVLSVQLLKITIEEVKKMISSQVGTPTPGTIGTILPKKLGGPTAELAEVFNQSGIAWNIIRLAVYYAEAVAFFFILYASFLYLTSYGDESKAENAKKTLIWSIIGLAVVIAANYLLAVFTELVV